MLKSISIVLAVILIIGVVMTGCSATPDTRQAKHGDTVQVHYTGRLADGTIFDSSEGREPFEFTLGAEQVIFGFEKAVSGMKVGEKKTVTIPVDEAYGPHTDAMVAEISRAQIGDGISPKVGQVLQTKRDDGGVATVIVTAVSDNTITIDGNHPLAGKDLTFDIELVKIK